MHIDITLPDDWHLHVRDQAIMQLVIAHTAAHFGRAIIMPNLKPPITTVSQAHAYYQSICAALPSGSTFTPLMTLYLTEQTSRAELDALHQSEHVVAIKYYPAGATTHSDAGVKRIENVYPILEHMQKLDIPLLVHAEVTDDSVDVFAREKVFIERHLAPLVQQFPQLRVVLEHISTADGVDFVNQASACVAATITPQHILLNRNALFTGGIRPHHYCLPVLKAERHRLAVLAAATSGNPKFFLGTDSAPHLRRTKETSCGCAGIYSAPIALALYAEAFDNAGALDKLEAFASFYGADFYRLPRNRSQIRLTQTEVKVPTAYSVDSDELVPLRAGETVAWNIQRLS